MKDLWIRQARAEDADAIAALNTEAFAAPDEARIVAQLAKDGDSLASLVALLRRAHVRFRSLRLLGTGGCCWRAANSCAAA